MSVIGCERLQILTNQRLSLGLILNTPSAVYETQKVAPGLLLPPQPELHLINNLNISNQLSSVTMP